MGLSFLKRKKKNKGGGSTSSSLLLQRNNNFHDDSSDPLFDATSAQVKKNNNNNNTDDDDEEEGTVSRFAILQPASTMLSNSSFPSHNNDQSRQSSNASAKAVRKKNDGSRDGNHGDNNCGGGGGCDYRYGYNGDHHDGYTDTTMNTTATTMNTTPTSNVTMNTTMNMSDDNGGTTSTMGTPLEKDINSFLRINNDHDDDDDDGYTTHGDNDNTDDDNDDHLKKNKKKDKKKSKKKKKKKKKKGCPSTTTTTKNSKPEPMTTSKSSKIVGKGNNVIRGFLQPSKRDTAPIELPPSSSSSPSPTRGNAKEDGECPSNILLDFEYDSSAKSPTGGRGGVELELTLGNGGGITASNNDAADPDDLDGYGYGYGYGDDVDYDVEYDVEYDEIDIANGSVTKRRESPDLTSYLESLGNVIEDLLVEEHRKKTLGSSRSSRKDDGDDRKNGSSSDDKRRLLRSRTTTYFRSNLQSKGRSFNRRGRSMNSLFNVALNEDVEEGYAAALEEDVVRRGNNGNDGNANVGSGAAARGLVDTAGGGYAESKFLSRLRKIGGTKGNALPNNAHNNNNNNNNNNTAANNNATNNNNANNATINTNPKNVNNNNANNAMPQANGDNRQNETLFKHPNPVPDFVHHSDDASMPSMLTEPEIRHRKQYNDKNKNKNNDKNNNNNGPKNQKKRARVITPGSDSGVDASQPRPSAFPFDRLGKGACGEEQQQPHHHDENDDFDVNDRSYDNDYDEEDRSGTFFGMATTVTGGFTTAASTAVSSASRVGGIERMLSVLTCGMEDATLLANAIRCEVPVVCGREREMDGEREVEREEEGEAHFALDFQDDIIRNGVKLIYHKSPAGSSANPDWIQSTVKLFLRPGNCHGSSGSDSSSPHNNNNKRPTLAWAVLPVVSRMQIVGNFDSSEEAMWSSLGLLDVHTILIDENTEENGCSNSPDADGNTAPTTITGFFSVTANDGAVHVFEAPSARQRDYVVRGLKAVIARLAYNMVAGNADVIGEMFSEDAGALTGELPSLVTPWKALHGVTHSFLDQL